MSQLLTRTLLPLADDTPKRTGSSDTEAGYGALSTAKGVLPLEALDVRGQVEGLAAQLNVCQTFKNTHDETLEATYIFPLPDRMAVTRFHLEVAGREVEGVLKERAEARQEYVAAVAQGHRAAIAEQERADVFTMRVGNLPPGESAVVRLTLVGPLPLSDGEVTFRFPLVVAPRYHPGTHLPGPNVGGGAVSDTDAVPDASRISPPVLLPGQPNPVQLHISVEVRPAGLNPTDFRSSLHSVIEALNDRGSRRVILHPGERLDRDFILRWRLGGGALQSSLTLLPDEQGDEGTFALTLLPPADGGGRQKPRDMAFVIDRSGSMGGWKMVAARRAVSRMVETLTDEDRFALIAFDDHIESPSRLPSGELVSAGHGPRGIAEEFLATLQSRGGTEMAAPLELAVHLLAGGDPTRERILVLITDGQVGNEDQILRNISTGLKAIRVFTLGIDQAVNHGFLRRLADLGGGAAEVVESEARLAEVMDRIHRQIGTPVLTGLRLTADGFTTDPSSFTPARTPDLFAGAPLCLWGRYRGAAEGRLRLDALDHNGKPWSETVAATDSRNPALAALWARGRLRDLEDRFATATGDRAELEREIVATSLRFGVLCRFTAFVAVDRAEVVNPGGQMRAVTQAVDAPAGWGQMHMDAMLAPMHKSNHSASALPALAAGPPVELSSVLSRRMSLRDDDDAPRASKRARARYAPPFWSTRLLFALVMLVLLLAVIGFGVWLTFFRP